MTSTHRPTEVTTARGRKSRRSSFAGDPYADLVALWVGRIIAEFRSYRPPDARGVGNGLLYSPGKWLDILGLPHESLISERSGLDVTRFAEVLPRRLRELERRGADRAGEPLAANAHALGEALELSHAERRLLVFAALLHEHLGLFGIAELATAPVNIVSLTRAVAAALGLSPQEVRAALRDTGALSTTTLLRVDHRICADFQTMVDMPKGFIGKLMSEEGDPIRILDRFFRLAPQGRVPEESFTHLGEDFVLLRDYLGRVLRDRGPGRNVLLYGPPGSGKTELARRLAEMHDARLYEVQVQDDDHDPISGRQREAAYRLCQSVLASSARSLVLFDEVEDVFGSSARWYDERHSERAKGWLNHVLEQNAVPAFWICNSIAAIDEAMMRRFDLVVKVDRPVRAVRERMLATRLARLGVSETFIRRLSQHDRIVPAHISRAAEVVEIVGAAGRPDVDQVVGRILGNTLQASGHRRDACDQVEPVTAYDPSYLNADIDIGQVLAGLARARCGSLCLYGPPGTGKTALAREIARRLDLPLVTKTASDLLAPLVGMTEAGIAEMFEKTRADGAVLLLDEADSLLRERGRARAGWEVTQVNEMLAQLDRFPGVFIASTNLIDDLDRASLRRFDFKVRFGFLRPEHARRLFRQVLAEQCGPEAVATRSDLEALNDFDSLALGDFANIARQGRVRPIGGAADLLERLRAECRMKDRDQGRPIGFRVAL